MSKELSKETKAVFEFMKEFAERRLIGELPEWQYRVTDGKAESGPWRGPFDYVPAFDEDGTEYRFTQKTIKINGVEVVAPRLPQKGSYKTVYTLDGTAVGVECNLPTDNPVFDEHEDAIAFRAALLKAIKGE